MPLRVLRAHGNAGFRVGQGFGRIIHHGRQHHGRGLYGAGKGNIGADNNIGQIFAQSAPLGRVLTALQRIPYRQNLIRCGAVFFGEQNIKSNGRRTGIGHARHQLGKDLPRPRKLTNLLEAVLINIDKDHGAAFLKARLPAIILVENQILHKLHRPRPRQLQADTNKQDRQGKQPLKQGRGAQHEQLSHNYPPTMPETDRFAPASLSPAENYFRAVASAAPF